MRTIVSRVVSASMLLSIAVPALAFDDVTTSTNYRAAIEALEEKGVIEGYSDGTFKPLMGINRAEFLKIVLEAKGGSYVTGDNCFPDVQEEWFAPYICRAKAQNIINGYPDGTFKPENQINVVEASKIMALAFGVEVQNEGGEWYAPYMRALEYSDAIPTTVSGLDNQMKRGEMAEILWRLTEEKTDQPSKSYMNVKYPDMKVNLASNTVERATSCADLRAFIQESQGSNDGMVYMDKGIGAVPPASPSPTLQGGRAMAESDDYSQTNVQVQGVDEADTVKTDGNYVYTIKGQSVRIVSVRPATELKETAIIDLAKENMMPSELYVDGDMLVVIGQVYQNYSPYPPNVRPLMDAKMIAPWYSSKTQVKIYDISVRSNPKSIRTVTFDGGALSTRRIEDKLYLVLNQNLWAYPLDNVKASDALPLPMFRDTARGDKDVPVVGCADVAIMPRIPSPQYLIVGVIPLDSPTAEVSREVVLGSAQNIYASLKNLYVSAPEWKYIWDGNGGSSEVKTTIYRFGFTDDGVELKAQGQVPGTIKNQFSMDEKDNVFRIATTVDSWSSNAPSKNNLYVLNANMETVGSIENIAPGEQIYSTRFMGDRAYMVTFKKIDPLFVIDLSDTRNPKILGKLKIPGYSDYLHPYDENHIIGFGKDATESKTGDFAWYQGMKLALFDVSDVENPKEMHSTIIGDRGTDSPLLYNHKALLFDKSKNLLAFPITVNKIPDNLKQGNDGSAYGTPVFQGAYVYDITLNKGFELRGTITQYDNDAFIKAGDYWYGDGRSIERILRVENSLITTSQDEVMSSNLSTLSELDRVKLQSAVDPTKQ